MEDASTRPRLEDIKQRIAATKSRLGELRARAIRQVLAGKLDATQADAVVRSLERSLFVLEDIHANLQAKLEGDIPPG